MSQIAKMFELSNARMEKITSGDYDRDQMLTAYREFSGQIKLVNTVIKAYQVGEKNPQALESMRKMRVMDDKMPVEGESAKAITK
jgi:DNA-binding transcriptional regulator YhcF (GntR family)